MWIKIEKISETKEDVEYSYEASDDFFGRIKINKVTNIIAETVPKDKFSEYYHNKAKAFVLRCNYEKNYPESKYYAYG